MKLLEGKRAAIFGVANDRSIAWAISEAFHAEGAELAFTYAGEILEKRVRPLAEGIGSKIILPCDVTKDEDIKKFFGAVKEVYGTVDFLVHSIAFAPRESLTGDFLDGMSRQAFTTAHEISSYSFAALAKAARPLLATRNASLLTLTYLGAIRVLANYNVMGLAKASLEANVRYLAHTLGPEGTRVNAISAGPVKTIAAAGIGG